MESCESAVTDLSVATYLVWRHAALGEEVHLFVIIEPQWGFTVSSNVRVQALLGHLMNGSRGIE